MSIRLNPLYHEPLSKISFLWYYANIMIPQFPEFKSLELSDKKDIESFTKRFPPYSDFNFVSMWSWDIKEEIRISQLNGNLVVRFTDYLTGKPPLRPCRSFSRNLSVATRATRKTSRVQGWDSIFPRRSSRMGTRVASGLSPLGMKKVRHSRLSLILRKFYLI